MNILLSFFLHLYTTGISINSYIAHLFCSSLSQICGLIFFLKMRSKERDKNNNNNQMMMIMHFQAHMRFPQAAHGPIQALVFQIHIHIRNNILHHFGNRVYQKEIMNLQTCPSLHQFLQNQATTPDFPECFFLNNDY